MDDIKRQQLVEAIQPKKGIKKGVLFGITSSAVLDFIYLLIMASLPLGTNPVLLRLTLLFALIGIAILILPSILFVNYIEKQNARRREYLAYIDNHRILSLDKIATSMNLSYEQVEKDIEKMIQQGFFGISHIDRVTRSIVLPVNGVNIHTQVTETTQKCPTCGADCKVSSIGNNKCEYCGTVLNYQQPSNQQSPHQMYQQSQYQPISANTCPKCGNEMKSKYHGWQIMVAIFLFPIGLLALLMDKQKKCSNCGFVIN